jgi:alginate O-acetyltransferase complex protein AlgJ
MKIYMKKFTINNYINSAYLVLTFFIASIVHSAELPSVITGKNEWLFTPLEFAKKSDNQDTLNSIQLIQKVNKLFERKGIALALVIVPSKIRIHADQLPDNNPLDSYTADRYENVFKLLQSEGLSVINLNQAFLSSPHRTSDTPLFFRLDTHWSPSGAMLAAETVKAAIVRNPALNTAYAATNVEKYGVTWSPRKVNASARDLASLASPDGKKILPEQSLPFKVTRVKPSQVGLFRVKPIQSGLLNAGDNIGITVIGSSYTNKNTGYPDALRFTLQRELLDISISVDQGAWVGMEGYLRNDAFKTNKPKLIIWEIPERELRSPPNSKSRDARYYSDNNEWYLRVVELLK